MYTQATDGTGQLKAWDFFAPADFELTTLQERAKNLMEEAKTIKSKYQVDGYGPAERDNLEAWKACVTLEGRVDALQAAFSIVESRKDVSEMAAKVRDSVTFDEWQESVGNTGVPPAMQLDKLDLHLKQDDDY
ncbi:MAG: hypothetical protein MHM6MM_008419 [Cercozoa sp. M6MM]